jgi:hypothetical protein
VQIKELVGICKEYVIALRCELKRKELKEDDMARAAELAAYFTHCNLQVRLHGGGWRVKWQKYRGGAAPPQVWLTWIWPMSEMAEIYGDEAAVP